MVKDHQEFDVIVTAVTSVGAMVDLGGIEGFIDLRKHPSWWTDAEPPSVGDRLHVVVLDESRMPPRLSALEKDIAIARRIRGEGQ